VTEGFTHLDDTGAAHMVDVAGKDVTLRRAVAEARLLMSETVRGRLFAGDLPKGDAIAAVRVAAIMGAKATPALIPLAHPIGLDSVSVAVEETSDGARIEVTCLVRARTGVEMEAMTGAAAGALTLYDMVKGLDRGAEIRELHLVSKSGGRSGEWNR
jgi:cyclic pyranopterin phosphate synthase